VYAANSPWRFVDPDGRGWGERIAGVLVGGMDFISFGAYSKYALPRLVEDGTMEHHQASHDYRAAKQGTEMALAVGTAWTGAGAIRGGFKAVQAARGAEVVVVGVSGGAAVAKGTASAAAVGDGIWGAFMAGYAGAQMSRIDRDGGGSGGSGGGSFKANGAQNLRNLGLGDVKLAGKSLNSGSKQLRSAGFEIKSAKDGRTVFENSKTGARVVHDQGKALGAGQKPHWTIQDRGGTFYDRSGRALSGPNPPMGGKHIPGD
jgi:hypothetical protein